MNDKTQRTWPEKVEALEKQLIEQARLLDGLTQDAINGGWTAKGLSDYAKKLEAQVNALENDEVRQRLANAEHQLYMKDLAIQNAKTSRRAQWRKRKAGEAELARLKAQEREKVRNEHAEWSQNTFGNVGPVGPLKHLSKEAMEAAAEPGDLSEWADMQFLLWDAQRRARITDEQITRAMVEKLAVNKARPCPEPKEGEPRMHIKVDGGEIAE